MSRVQEEFALLDQARSMGFSIISPRRSGEGFQFRREGWCVWRCIYDPSQWVIAPVDQVSARNEQYYRASLDEALILAVLLADVCEDEPVLMSA